MKLQSVSEYYFGNILDRLVQLSEYSFKNKSAVEAFLDTFNHVRFMTKKDASLASLIDKELFRVRFVEVLGNLQKKISFTMRR